VVVGVAVAVAADDDDAVEALEEVVGVVDKA